MTIRCKCEHCGTSLKVKDSLAGKTKPCPQCQQPFTIPAPTEERSNREAKPTGIPNSPSGEDDFPYFDDVPVQPLRSKEGGAFASPLAGGGEEEYDPYAPPPRTTENKFTGSAAGIASELLRKIETTDRKTGKGSGAANKKKGRKLFGDVDDQMSTSEASVGQSFLMLSQGFLLPLLGLSVLVLGVYWGADYLMGSRDKMPPLGRVTGKVQIDGRPIPNARLTFQPTEALAVMDAKNLGSSAGISDGNGNYMMFYVQGIPGAVIGKHKITVSAMDANGQELVPLEWNQNPGNQVEVKAGSNTFNFEIQTNGSLPSQGGASDPSAASTPAAALPASGQ